MKAKSGLGNTQKQDSIIMECHSAGIPACFSQDSTVKTRPTLQQLLNGERTIIYNTPRRPKRRKTKEAFHPYNLFHQQPLPPLQEPEPLPKPKKEKQAKPKPAPKTMPVITVFNYPKFYHHALPQKQTPAEIITVAKVVLQDTKPATTPKPKRNSKSALQLTATPDNSKDAALNDIFNYFVTHSGLVARALTDKRKAEMESCIKQFGVQSTYEVINKVAQSNFLQGENNRGWKANFDWVFNQNNFIKILEDRYENRKPNSNDKSAPFANIQKLANACFNLEIP